MIGEGVVNMFFFADNPLGLLGGFFTAFMISLVNVGASAIAGCLREIVGTSCFGQRSITFL